MFQFTDEQRERVKHVIITQTMPKDTLAFVSLDDIINMIERAINNSEFKR